MSRLDHGEHLAARGQPGARVGCIEVVCGSMFSGKTEELLRRLKRARLAKQNVLLFKPRLDDRYDAVKVVSHEGIAADAIPVADPEELLEQAHGGSRGTKGPLAAVIGIDEVQFFDARIVSVAQALADAGVRVIAAGLDQDYRGEPFGPMGPLLAVAEYVTKLHAVCAVCGAHASRSQRLVAREGQLFVGGAAAYEARCRACFVPEVIDRKSVRP
jgi:thymidine kinase